MAGGHRHVDSKGKAGAEELLIMAPFKINKTIAATFFMVLIMSCALTSTSACRRVVRSAPLKNHTAQWIRAEKNAKT
uniref:Uncharacterized protein n=1 Tax=Oryza glumipatula TaxID=40148 RepID=A0A0E0BPF1_9ORYZ